MILRSDRDQSEFELRLVDYQYPHIENEYWDANWLFVSIRVTSPIASWTHTDPCLMTAEARDLANWLGDVAFNRQSRTRLFFIEPNLSFEFVGRDADICELRLYFALESSPPGIEAYSDEFFLSFTMTAEALRLAANQLCASLRSFPIRANPPGLTPECREI
jgi:hypothetical protein